MSKRIEVTTNWLHSHIYGVYLAWGDYLSIGLGKRELVIEFG